MAQPTTSPGAAVTDLPLAGLGRRFGALLIDWILCVLVAGLYADPRRAGWPPSVVLLVEYTFFVGLFTQTPGMWLTKIRCVKLDGSRLGVFRAFVRGFLLNLLIPALIMDKRQRGLHDRAVDSIMLAAHRPT